MARDSLAVEVDVLGEIRVRGLEEIRYANGYRIDRPAPDDDGVHVHHFPRLHQREEAVGTTDREKQVNDQTHERGSLAKRTIGLGRSGHGVPKRAANLPSWAARH